MPLNWITMQMFAEAAGERWHRARSELPGLEKGRTTSSKVSINVCQHRVDLRHHCLSNRKEISTNRATWLTQGKCYQHPNSTTPTRAQTQNPARQRQNLKENIYKKKAGTCTRSAKQSTAKPRGRQGTRSSHVLPAPPDRNSSPNYSFIPHSAVPHLNLLPGDDVFLIFLLNNWNTQINILEDECWHKYYSTRMMSTNSSCTFLWSCCLSVCHLMLPRWIIDWKSIFKISGHIHWLSSALPGDCFHCPVKEQI